MTTTAPVPKVRVDWDNDGSFTTSGDDITVYVTNLTWTKGRSADFSTDATGAASFTLQNKTGIFTPDADWVGKPVHIYSTYLGTDYPHFYGFIERVTPNPKEKTIDVTCYDVFRLLGETDVVVPENAFHGRSARDFRTDILSDYERGARNLIVNPSFETNTTGWSTPSGGTLTRSATDAAPGAGSAYGSFVATTTGQSVLVYARLAPYFFESQVYRFSVYLKVAAGTATWVIGLGTTFKDVTVTTSWQRFTLTYVMPAGAGASDDPLYGYVQSTAAGTVRIDAASITRGQALYPYSNTGTGRWPNWIGNGGFEGGEDIEDSLGGWFDQFKNLCTNGNLESGTTGWTSVSQITTAPLLLGSAYGRVGAGNTGKFDFSGTFVSGETYGVTLWLYVNASGGNGSVTVTLGSIGTPADIGTTGVLSVPTGWVAHTLFWSPSANRTDARLSIIGDVTNSTRFDAVGVYRLSSFQYPTLPPYMDTGIGGGGTYPTSSLLILAGVSKYGSRSHEFITSAVVGSGRIYDFNHYGSYFVSGQQYVLSIWVNPTSSMPYKVGIGGAVGDGSFDEASTTGTASANVWTQITRTWTPSADRDSSIPFTTMAYIQQTDTTSRTVQIDGVRVIPGGTADAYEEAHWDLTLESDLYLPTASMQGSALSSLSTLNGLTLSRHWIEPQMTSPYYTYVTSSRDDIASKSSTETFSNDFYDLSGTDVDRGTIINTVGITFSGPEVQYYSDSDSVNTYGVRSGSLVQGEEFFPDQTVPEEVGAAILIRYSVPRARPTLIIRNRFPTQLTLELDDLITVVLDRLGINGDYLVQTITTTVTEAGMWWETEYVLEEYAY